MTPAPDRKRILAGWEFGEGQGHLKRLSFLASAASELEYEFFFAVTDPSRARRFLGETPGVRLLQAPASKAPRSPGSGSQKSLPDILMRRGFDDPDHWHLLLSMWTQLVHRVNPSVVISDSAPSLQLAALALEKSLIITGSGFTERSPDGLSGSKEQGQAERRVLEAANHAGRQWGVELNGIADLFDAYELLLTNILEFDPYGPRGEKYYLGPTDCHERQRRAQLASRYRYLGPKNQKHRVQETLRHLMTPQL